MKNKKLILAISTFAVLSLLVVAVAIFSGSFLFAAKQDNSAGAAAAPANAQIAAQTAAPTSAKDMPAPFDGLTAENPAHAAISIGSVLAIIGRLILAVIFSSILAFRPRRNIPLFQRNLYVAQTQILLAVVAAALMLIVGDNTARAFAIFAAVSLVRFRTNIRDPKEITVLLISLALGLAAGVGRWDLGFALCFFALGLLWLLEQGEPEKVFRSMELTVKTRNTDSSQELLKRIFNTYRLDAEIRQIDTPDEENPIGCIMYYLNLPLSISTDQLSDKILDSDAVNIDGIEWKQKKDGAYIYQ